METVVDILAARLTGLELAKRYSEDALWKAHMANPEVRALREGWLASRVDYLCHERIRAAVGGA